MSRALSKLKVPAAIVSTFAALALAISNALNIDKIILTWVITMVMILTSLFSTIRSFMDDREVDKFMKESRARHEQAETRLVQAETRHEQAETRLVQAEADRERIIGLLDVCPVDYVGIPILTNDRE